MERRFSEWVTALEARHLANLRVREVTRALRALSSAYVERRRRPAAATSGGHVQGALDSAGKRAAFALFYAPLHFLAVAEVIRRYGGTAPPPSTIVDLGCGTGAAGAAWALSSSATPAVVGIDRHPWAVDETRWTYHQLGVRGRARQGDISRVVPVRRGDSVVVAYVLNELPDAARIAIEGRLMDVATHGGRVLVIEPIARAIAPWWDDMAARFAGVGGRSDRWRLPVDLPPLVERFDRAAGLNHRELTFRTLFV